MTVKAVFENTGISHYVSVSSVLNVKESRAVLLWKVFFWELLPYWQWGPYFGLLWRGWTIIILQLTALCSVHSVTELAGVKKNLLKLCLRLLPERDSENTTLTRVRMITFYFNTQKDNSQFYKHKVQQKYIQSGYKTLLFYLSL